MVLPGAAGVGWAACTSDATASGPLSQTVFALTSDSSLEVLRANQMFKARAAAQASFMVLEPGRFLCLYPCIVCLADSLFGELIGNTVERYAHLLA